MRIFSLVNMRIILLLLCLNPLWPAVFAQNYLWPTNASQLVSSLFGEYRTNHLHSGLDIKTNQRTGYPVFATAAGYIWKIRAGSRGYGKVIYQRLDDGNFAVYAHLDDFNRTLRTYLQEEQRRQQRYAVEIIFAPHVLRVSRGDTIGYTGDTGSLHPHLHFEIRDSLENPLNPLNTNLRVQDNTRPEISAIALTPVQIASRINGLPLIQTFKTKLSHKNVYTVPDTIQVTGAFGIDIKARDVIRGLPHSYPPYGIKLFVDDSLAFQVQYDQFSFAQTRLVEIERNYQLDQEIGEVFNRLWTFDSTKTMPMYTLPDADGILTLSPGCHKVRIEVYDKYRNEAQLLFDVYSRPVRNISITGISVKDNTCRVSVQKTGLFRVSELMLDWVGKYGDYLRPAPPLGYDSTATEYFMTVSEMNRPYEYLRITGTAADGLGLYPAFVRTRGATLPGALVVQRNFYHNPKTFLCELTFKEPPEVYPSFYLQTSTDMQEVALIQRSPVEFVTAPAPLQVWQSAFAGEVRLPTQPLNMTRFRLNFSGVVPAHQTQLVSSDSVCSINFPPQAVYDTLIVWWGKANLSAPAGGKLESAIYELLPTSQPLHDSIQVAFKYPTFLASAGQVGIYQFLDNAWRFVGNQTEYRTDAIKGKVRRLGAFALIRDEVPPVIRNIFPGSGGRFRISAVTELRAGVRDYLSGIQDDLSIQVRLDDQPVIAEYHGVKHYIRYKLPTLLSMGPHTLTITARDRAGNVSTARSVFTMIPEK